jgi:hypothetical protein
MAEEAATVTKGRAKSAAEPEVTPAAGITAAELLAFVAYRRRAGHQRSACRGISC